MTPQSGGWCSICGEFVDVSFSCCVVVARSLVRLKFVVDVFIIIVVVVVVVVDVLVVVVKAVIDSDGGAPVSPYSLCSASFVFPAFPRGGRHAWIFSFRFVAAL